jgi:hypothetical protein
MRQLPLFSEDGAGVVIDDVNASAAAAAAVTARSASATASKLTSALFLR